MHKLPLHCSVLLSLVLSFPAIAKPIKAEIDPSTAEREQVPRTLKEAGFSSQPISAAPRSISQATEPPTPASPSETSAADLRVSPRIGGSFTTGPGVGYESSFGAVEGFVPLAQTPGQDLAFLQGRVLLSTDEARLGGNLVLGYRTYSGKTNRVLGGYLSYDIRDTGNSTFNQVGLGLESLGDSLDFRVNGYIPVGDTRQKTEENSFSTSGFTPQAPTFQGNFLAIGSFNQITQINRRFEAALGGVDAEAGVRIARIGETGGLRGYGGLYYYDGPGTAGVVGVRGRLEARPNDNFRLGLLVQSDSKFGTNVVFSIAANFPGTRPRGARPQDEVVARLGEGVTRQENVVVEQQRESRVSSTPASFVFATNPATNQPYLFQHVNLGIAGGNGTFETPFGTVQNALGATRSDGNDIVYVQPGSNPGIPAFTIPNNVQVLSTGPVQIVSTVQQGNVQLPLSGAGVLPTVLPSGSTVPGITMGNNTTVSGFALNNATNVGIGNEGSTGTGANPISNVTIRDNQIVGSGNEGIRLTNVTGAINLFNNTVTNSVTGDAIRIANESGQANFTINRNTLTGNSRVGIFIFSSNTAQVNPTIFGNTISGNGIAGIFFSSRENSQTTATVSGNTISGTRATEPNTGQGIFVTASDNSTLRLLIDSNSISGNAGNGVLSQINGSSNLFSTVRSNTLTNNNSDPAPGNPGNFSAQSIGDNSTVCLNLANNTSINPNPAGADFNFVISPTPSAQFLFIANGNAPGAINFLSFTAGFPPADPARFVTPLGNCVVP